MLIVNQKIDFGDIVLPFDSTIQFFNSDDTAISFSLKPSCGCICFEVPKFVLQSGETIDAKVSISIKSSSGVEKPVYVVSDDQVIETIVLKWH